MKRGVNERRSIRQRVRDVHDDRIVLIRLDGRAGIHPVDDKHRFLHAIWCAKDLRDSEIVVTSGRCLADDGSSDKVAVRCSLKRG